MEIVFETAYDAIIEKIQQIDPVKYASTRNYVDGDITLLSPYISRGVISTRQVLEAVLRNGYQLSQIESFVKELCWRDYFQRVAQQKNLNTEIRQAQTPITNHGISAQIITANTGIEGIDHAIKKLYKTGYMHNHCRMYTASLACNIGKSHWYHPAKWMYYHLLDGDWASNACSWQWVAGANSSKKYYANQENINKYTHTDQSHTYLDLSYEELEKMDTPTTLSDTEIFPLVSELPDNTNIKLDGRLPTFIYNYYQLDPQWHKDTLGNRILLLEPDFFAEYPVSKKCMEFILALSKNIPDIQLYVGSFQSLIDKYAVEIIYYKEHPLNTHYSGIQEERDWIAKDVAEYYPSFFGYWKKVEKHLKNK